MPWKVVNRTGKHKDKPYMAIPKEDSPWPGWIDLDPAVEGTKKECENWMKHHSRSKEGRGNAKPEESGRR